MSKNKLKVGTQIQNPARLWIMEVFEIKGDIVRFMYFHNKCDGLKMFFEDIEINYNINSVKNWIKDGSWKLVENKVDFDLIRTLYEGS